MSDFTPRWSRSAIAALYDLPFNDLLFQAQTVHRANFPPNDIQLSSLLSIKRGGCSENCKYCAQSSKADSDVPKEALIDVPAVVKAATTAREAGATRFCMGAAWRSLKDRHLPMMVEMIKAVKALGMEVCMTLGLVTLEQAIALKEAGLDYYNHNLNTAREYHDSVVTTHRFDDRLTTLDRLRQAGIKICCGGIVGMGESREHRVSLIAELANSDPPPETVPVNRLVPIPGTPFESTDGIDDLEFVRTVAVCRITMPTSVIRLSAGRETMSIPTQALCFLAGAGSIFYGEALLTVGNAAVEKDRRLLAQLGLTAQTVS